MSWPEKPVLSLLPEKGAGWERLFYQRLGILDWRF
jgi:hypothetical protein